MPGLAEALRLPPHTSEGTWLVEQDIFIERTSLQLERQMYDSLSLSFAIVRRSFIFLMKQKTQFTAS